MSDLKPMILESIDIDLNKLFSLSYTFDNLKSFMSSLLKNQSLITDKINELENKLKQQIEINKNNNIKQNNYENKLQSLETYIIGNNNKGKKDLKEKYKDKENNTIKKDIIENKNEINEEQKFEIKNEIKKDDKQEKNDIIKERQFGEMNNNIKNEKYSSIIQEIEAGREGKFKYGNNNELLLDDNQEIKKIKNRLSFIETKLKEYNLSLNQPKLHFIDDNFRNEEIDLIKNKIKNISQKTEEMRKQKDELQKKVEEISIKVLDFNIMDIIKNSPISGEGKIDPDRLLSINLEQKFTKKSLILDEKYKKAEEEINKIKNNFENLKINFDVIEQSYNLTKTNIKDLKEEIMKSNIDYRNLIAEINGRINENFIHKLEEQKKGTNKELDKLRQQIKNLNDKGIISEKDTNKIGSSLSDNDLQYISELSKKITDIEKQITLIYIKMESNSNKGNNEIIKIENELLQKINQKDFFELNEKVNVQNTISNNIREMVERVQEISNKNMKDLNFFLRKIESLSGSVVSMQNFIENISGMKKENPIDLTVFLKKESFNEFIKIYDKEKKGFERNIEEFHRIITDVSDIIKTKTSDNDLKNFETIINNKIEELKINCGKKFADKIDTSKSLKYLDAQIKYMNDLCIKKGKQDNWLLAKKPVGGFSCASCENYIGDLKDKNDFIHWNKYPQRDTNKYRVGNGFSRMLNMLNIDIKNSIDNLNINSYDSEDETFDKNQNIHQTNNTINFNISQGMKNSYSNKNRNSLRKNIIQILKKDNLPKINSFDNINNNENNIDIIGMNKTVEAGTSVQFTNRNKINENEDNTPHIIKVFKKK